MRSRTRYLGFLAFVALGLLGACANEVDSTGASQTAPSTVTGVIGSIDPPQGPIESFELVRPGEDPQRILVDPELDYGFDLQHLHEHMDEALPVRVGLENREGTLYAISINDA